MPYRVLSAKPDSNFTYNATLFQKDGSHSEIAKTQYRRLKEEGNIILTHAAQTYKVTHSTNSGIWGLQLDDPHTQNQPLILATKPKWYRKAVTFEMEGETYEMVRPSKKNRDYEVARLEKGGIAQASSSDAAVNYQKKDKKKPGVLRRTKVGELVTDGAVKRSYTVRFDDDIRVELPLFCYWIVSLLNKRSAQDELVGEAIDPFVI